MIKTAVLNYGSGNIFSLTNALDHIGIVNELISISEELDRFDQVIIPGVGSFSGCMEKLYSSGILLALDQFIKSGRKVLGICIGMQILFDKSFEFGESQGLGVFTGGVERIPDINKYGEAIFVPHVGWNRLQFNQSRNFNQGTAQILKQLDTSQEYYFVHSYMAKPLVQAELLAVTDYNRVSISAAVGRNNILGLQFHPEKSGEAGLILLKHWADF